MRVQPSTFDSQGRHPALAVVGVLFAISCSGCPSSPDAGTDAVGETCSIEACNAACRVRGPGWYGSCGGGTCGCIDGGDADASSDHLDVGPTDGGDDDAVPGDDSPDDSAEDAGPDGSECLFHVEPETRPGASPGVTCHRASAGLVEDGLIFNDGDGDRVLTCGEGPDGSGLTLWEYRRSSGCLRIVEPGYSSAGGPASTGWPSVEGSRVAYGVMWATSSDAETCEIRLRDLETGEVRVIDSNTSADQPGGVPGCFNDFVVLGYPWVVWRDIREHPPGGTRVIPYQPNALAINAETGELLNLSLDPVTGDQRVGGADRTDIAGGLAVIGASWFISDPYPGVGYVEVAAFDFATRTWRQITSAVADQYQPTVSEDWIVWADQRNAPGYDWFHPCFGDIFAYNRSTGVEIPLVTEGDVLHGPSVDAEGPWLVYNDQRWDPEPECDSDREQDIVAMYLPTRTEIRITDWPGIEAAARVYDRRDGTYGVLLRTTVGSFTYRLWDCDLPVPEAGGG